MQRLRLQLHPPSGCCGGGETERHFLHRQVCFDAVAERHRYRCKNPSARDCESRLVGTGVRCSSWSLAMFVSFFAPDRGKLQIVRVEEGIFPPIPTPTANVLLWKAARLPDACTMTTNLVLDGRWLVDANGDCAKAMFYRWRFRSKRRVPFSMHHTLCAGTIKVRK